MDDRGPYRKAGHLPTGSRPEDAQSRHEARIARLKELVSRGAYKPRLDIVADELLNGGHLGEDQDS